MPRRITDDVIAARMVELRNLRKLHAHDRKQIAELKAENKELRQLLAQALEKIDAQAIQIAELQTMVFGKKKRPPAGGTPATPPNLFALPKQPRTKDSYRRPVPPASAITSEVAVPLPDTCICGGTFNPNTVTVHERYEEDIPLPELTRNYQPHLVTKYFIERGECLACGKAATGGNKDLGGQAVVLGPNVRLLVCHFISVGWFELRSNQPTYFFRSMDWSSPKQSWPPCCESSILSGYPPTNNSRRISEPHPSFTLTKHRGLSRIYKVMDMRGIYATVPAQGSVLPWSKVAERRMPKPCLAKAPTSPLLVSVLRMTTLRTAASHSLESNSSAGRISIGLFVISATMPIFPSSSCPTSRSGMPASLTFTPTYALISGSRTTESYELPKQSSCGSEYN